MTLWCALRELHETVEENIKLRKQISELMVQNQQQVSAMSNLCVQKPQVFQNNCSCSSVFVSFFFKGIKNNQPRAKPKIQQ